MTPPDMQPEGAQPSAAWQNIVADLECKRLETVQALEALVIGRRVVAMAATAGDKAAQGRLEELNRRSGELVAEIDHIAIRRDAATEQVAAWLEARAHVGEAPRRPAPVAIARALLAESRRADAAMAALVAALDARSALARRLAGTGRGQPQLTNPTRVLAAAAHAGLPAHLPLNRAPERLLAKLADADAVVLRDLLKPSSANSQEHAA